MFYLNKKHNLPFYFPGLHGSILINMIFKLYFFVLSFLIGIATFNKREKVTLKGCLMDVKLEQEK